MTATTTVTRRSMVLVCSLVALGAFAGCGGDGSPRCGPGAFAAGDPDGHPAPLAAGPGEARAGRIRAEDLPAVPSGLVTWKAGDFVLANSKVALVIEDVGDSDLYDPWGGRPVGLARVAGGKLVEPNNFGELFLLTGRSTVVTDSVSVISDGTGGKPAIIRARGKLAPLPFFESVVASLFRDTYGDVDAAIDYELAPGAEHVDVRYRYAAPDERSVPFLLHALMYTKRTPVFQPGKGFDEALQAAPYVALVDDQATSWAYVPGSGTLGAGMNVSGFVGAIGDGFAMPACAAIDRVHARIVIGSGPGLDGVVAAVARTLGKPQREVTGMVTRDGAPQNGVHVHAVDAAGGYLTRATTDTAGGFTLHVPADAAVALTAFRRGDGLATSPAGTAPVALALPATGAIHVVATEGTARIPVRVQVLPAAGQPLPAVVAGFGEAATTPGRLHVAYAVTGDITLSVPPGSWEIVVSRGYEYELVRRTVDVTAGATTLVEADLTRSVATPGVQCGDFHVHTWRSNDSGDDALTKVAQAVADGVELPVRSDHEWVADFSQEIAQLGVERFAAGIGSIELTSFEIWGHMGVFPLTPDPTAVNAGAPLWQTFPTADHPDVALTTMSPPKVFDAVRARREAPLVIINHPRGGANYFDYVGFDPATGLASSAADWDTKFTLVEVFNNSGWQQNRTRNVNDWLGLLRAGRKVFAVGSSDSHGIVGSPVGYPRTCLTLGTDDPRQLTPNLVRDQLAAGHGAVSGGIYVSAKLGQTVPGDTTTGAGSPQTVDITVQAASWVDVTAVEVVVDGQIADTIPVLPGDAEPGTAVRWRGQVPIQIRATGGFVIVAAYGDKPLEPVHPGKIPFGVTEPIFVVP
ncbi:MAG TPA: CehA/McbA family metallohydrolase [Kofleriaceae bacterium]